MTSSDWLWKGIFFWFSIIYHLNFAGVHGHHDNYCSVLDNRDGICAPRRLCREAAKQFLTPCGGEDHVCCPLPTQRSARPSVPYGTSAPRTTEATTRPPTLPDRPKKEPPVERYPPAEPDDDSRRRIDPYRPEIEREPELKNTDYDIRPTKQADRNRPSGSKPADRTDDRYFPDPRTSSAGGGSRKPGQNRPSAPRDDDYDQERKRRPPSAAPYPRPPRDDIEREGNPPRRPKPPRSSPRPDETPKTQDVPREAPQVPACGVRPYDLFIAGGETSDKSEWPWMAAIFQRFGNKPKTFQCGGSLINRRYVLTAAHCFVKNRQILPASSFVVHLGSNSLTSGEEYAVSSLVLHQNHSGMEFFNDIALVRLSTEVFITHSIAPICLPVQDMVHENFVDRMGIVAGWGDTHFRSDSSRVLQHVSVPIVSNEDCAHAYRRVRGAVFLARGSDHVMCAGLKEGGKDACQGDSGGPLMLKSQDDLLRVVGIVSLGYKCAEPGFFGVYTRVTHYLKWINDNMKSY